MAEWKQFKLTIPGKDYLEQVREVLETLLVYLEVLKAILETIKAFLIDFGNPIRALVEALIKLILALIESLRQTGLYGYFDIPDPQIDPNFNRNLGGSVAFVQRFKASLYDTKDPWRPQPVNLFNEGGYIILMVDAGNVMRLIRLIRILLRFFGKEFTSPRYEAPANVKVLPVGDDGDPILAVAKVFSSEINAIAVEWSSPTTQRNPDPGFLDLVGEMANEFVPPKFLIEYSFREPSQEIDIADLTSDDATGIVMYQRETGFEVRGRKIQRREQLRDTHNEPIQRFQRYRQIDMSDPTFWLGQLGTYRYIFTGVPQDQTIWIRVRAFSGQLKWKDEANGILDFSQTILPWGGYQWFYWPSENNDEPVMGKPSGVFRVRLPNIPPNFDVLENLKRLFQIAFSLNFHLPPDTEYTGPPENQTLVRPRFDDNGYPIDPTTIVDIGQGSLADVAGPIAALDVVPIVSIVADATTLAQEFQPDAITGQLPQMPWQKFSVRYQANRLAVTVASALLEAGSGAIGQFQTIMQGPLPKGSYDIEGAAAGKTTLEQAIFAITDLTDATDLGPWNVGDSSRAQATSYGQAFINAEYRLNVLYAINFIKSFTLGGYPPDWVSVALFRDVIPWGADILYRILDAIQALLDAFNGVMQEIKDFIDLLIRKIEALEKFIEFLISIMEYIIQLDVSCYTLNSGTLTGGLPSWIDAVDNATGDAPPNEPGGYSAGIVLAYVAPDVSAIRAAFDIIFGAP